MSRRPSGPAPAQVSAPPEILPDHLPAQLLEWFAGHRRDLPWRQGYAPYHVWLSEIMLQQTQMDRAVEYFLRFTARYPDIAALAAAREDELLKLWEGLGYYSRARNLLRAAQVLVRDHGGRLPQDPAALRRLPGVGPYTAAAVASIAFGQPVAVVDANVERVLARLLDIAAPVKEPATARNIQQQAQAMVDTLAPGEARNFNQGLMELGALVCRPRQPRCSACPWLAACLAQARDTILERPLPRTLPATIDLTMACGVLIHDGLVYIQRRPPQGVWAGLWEFPGGCLESGETPGQCVAREYREETELAVTVRQPLAVVRHSYTRYRVTLHAFVCTLDGPAQPVLHAASEHRWVRPAQLAEYAFPAGHRQLLEVLARQLVLTP